MATVPYTQCGYGPDTFANTHSHTAVYSGSEGTMQKRARVHGPPGSGESVYSRTEYPSTQQ